MFLSTSSEHFKNSCLDVTHRVLLFQVLFLVKQICHSWMEVFWRLVTTRSTPNNFSYLWLSFQDLFLMMFFVQYLNFLCTLLIFVPTDISSQLVCLFFQLKFCFQKFHWIHSGKGGNQFYIPNCFCTVMVKFWFGLTTIHLW